MDRKPLDRRRFLKNSVVMTGVAVGAMRSASSQTPEVRPKDPRDPRLYGERSPFEKTAREIERDGAPLGPFASPALLTPLQDLDGIITPASLHYVNDHGLPISSIDPRQHRLLIHGMVERPLIFTMEELKRLPSISRIYFLECPGNTTPSRDNGRPRESVQESHGRTSCSEWTGVPLSLLLKGAGVKPGASWMVAEAADPHKYAKSIPLDKGMNDCLVAYSQNGEAVRPENGYPLRLVVPGWEGIACVKWLRRIKVVDEPYLFNNEIGAQPSLRLDGKARWFQNEMGPNSVITRPSGKQRLPGRGFYVITGIAWSGGGAIRRVEVSTDGGRTWKDARLEEPVLRLAHARFNLDWNWDGEEAVLQSRCTDERGEVQPSLEELGKIWGVKKDFWQTATTNMGHFNPIYPWKVMRDGSIHNALFA